MRKPLCRLFGYLTLLLSACTSPIDLDLDSGSSQIVVEAEMSNLLEAYTVTLSSTTDFDGISDRTAVQGADVRIIEEGGVESSQLFEASPGQYQSVGGDFRGEIGGNYLLRIALNDGRIYESDIVTIPDPVPILSSEARLEAEQFVNEDLVESVIYSQDLVLELENTAEDHFVIFDNRGFVESSIVYPTCGGFDRENQGMPAGPVQCWAFRDPITTDIVLGTNQNVSGESYEVLAITIPFDFRGRYVVDIDVKAMDAQSFNFWQQTRDQLDRGDGLFDAPFAPIVGNIRNVNNPEEVVLGYFNAYGKSTTQLCFDWPEIGNFPTPLVSCSTLCTSFYAPAVFQLPIAEQLCN